ncbi:hypothetical protein K1719_011520 [Acacia pycnantha]|nr:hypothetical protein K1719_011520 [Acacia pycnantha]
MFHGSKSLKFPVYDKPVYDDDIFDGFPGLKSSSKGKYDNIFALASSAPPGAFDDLLDGFGKVIRRNEEQRLEQGTKKQENQVLSLCNSPQQVYNLLGQVSPIMNMMSSLCHWPQWVTHLPRPVVKFCTA